MRLSLPGSDPGRRPEPTLHAGSGIAHQVLGLARIRGPQFTTFTTFTKFNHLRSL